MQINTDNPKVGKKRRKKRLRKLADNDSESTNGASSTLWSTHLILFPTPATNVAMLRAIQELAEQSVGYSYGTSVRGITMGRHLADNPWGFSALILNYGPDVQQHHGR